MNDRIRWLVVFIYAVAMAWVESAVVFYLRTMVNRIDPYQPNPLPINHGLGRAEIVREAATMVMLAAVGLLAGRTWRGRAGYFAIAFGAWDIFYYVFLKVICGWPHSVMDWDVLFLIPLPWWGPVAAPVLISILLILWGTLLSQFEHVPKPLWPRIIAVGLGGVGVGLALGVFMFDTMAAVPHGMEAVRNVRPANFHWPLFCGALLLMSAPVLHLLPPLMKPARIQ